MHNPRSSARREQSSSATLPQQREPLPAPIPSVVAIVVVVVVVVVIVVIVVVVRQRDKSGHGKNPSERGLGLESTDGRTSQDTERIRVSNTLTSWRARTDRQGRMRKGSKWARAGEHRRMDESGHGKNPSERGHLPPREHGRMSQDVNSRERGQGLESTDGWVSQDTERIRVSEGYSPSGDWGPGMRFGPVPTGRVCSNERCRH